MTTIESLSTAAETAPAGTTPEQEPELRPAIWVASLLDHEYLVPHGAWIEANQPTAAIRADIDTMLAASPVGQHTGAPADRWQIFRHRGFGGYPLTAWEGLARISELGTGLAEHGRPFAAWARIAEADKLPDFDSAYIGHYDSLHAFIEQLVNDLGYNQIVNEGLPAGLRPYVKIDLHATGHDLTKTDDISVFECPDGGVWIFHG